MIKSIVSFISVFLFALCTACATDASQVRSVSPTTPINTLPQSTIAAAVPTNTRARTPILATGAPANPTPTSGSGAKAVPTPDVLPTSVLTGKIVYSHEGDIYVIDASNSQVTQLTTDPGVDFDPVWSPDGKSVAFRSHRDGNEEVYRMQADGSDQQNLSNAPGGDYSPAWSPDGEGIAFMSDRRGNPNVWVMRPDGSDVRQVTNLPGISEYPTWSPDSNRLAFQCTFGRVLSTGTGDFEICVVNADGTDLVQLTDDAGESKLPAWSHDGTRIAFQSNRNGWPTLPDYTPPGYDPGQFGDYESYEMNADGSAQHNLTMYPRADDTFPAWSRDGHLVFSRYGCLLVLNPRDHTMTQISEGSCAGKDSGQFPDWYQP